MVNELIRPDNYNPGICLITPDCNGESIKIETYSAINTPLLPISDRNKHKYKILTFDPFICKGLSRFNIYGVFRNVNIFGE